MNKYRPSNGTEGMIFIDNYCCNCIHEKFMHSQVHGDMQCDILNRSMLHEVEEKEYPDEWTYDDNGNPICTEWKKWDWGSGDIDGDFNEPPPVYPDDPNQLCLPFIFDELGIKQIKKELV